MVSSFRGLALFGCLAVGGWSVAADTGVAGSSNPATTNEPVSNPSGSAVRDGELRPATPNPFLSFLPSDAVPDYRYWRAVMRRGAQQRRQNMTPPARTVAVVESEPNDSSATADLIGGFGTGDGEDPAADISGSFIAPTVPTLLGPFAEDEGSIPLASETGLVAGGAVTLDGTIGDGPFGSGVFGSGAFGSGGTGSGDYDFFRIGGVSRGQLILIDIDTAMPMAGLDTFVALYDSAGNFIRLNEDGDASVSFDSFIALPAPADDDYYVSVGGSMFPFVSALTDPFDSSSGRGVASEGDYTLTLGLEFGDQDWFSFDLETCDILGINLLDAGTSVSVRGPGGELLVASAQDLSFAYPAASTLPGGGAAVLAFVASESGTYRVRALGAGGPNYNLELRLFRQPLVALAEAKTLFVDFDGATVDPVIFGGTAGPVTLSPLSSFLSGWGLGPADEDAVVDAVLASLKENLQEDLTAGPSPGFAVQLLNSRDHADPFGDPGVSRLIIGGSISELGLPTIGIAQSIDPGNFAQNETAVILLDLLSADAINPDSLNSFPLAPGATIIDLIGVALGNIAAHEAGHYTGNFHTEQFGASPASLMDQGGNLPNTLGLGEDGVFGSADDMDVDFGTDQFANTEGFAGFEDTQAVISCGCTIDSVLFIDGFEAGNTEAWSFVSD